MDELILEVSQVNTYIKEMMEQDALLTGLCVRGELSNYKRYPSGHHYFTLKDGTASLKCVMFRSSAVRLRFTPENGMMVLAAGRITVYPRDGVYQLYCVSMHPEGTGDLTVAFEQMKKKLEGEGLFDEAHKKPIPAYPHRIALVTSSAGAALRDMLRILGHRYPLAEVLLLPVRVQGTEAPGEIAAAIDYANQFHVADLMIVGRGGGSIEDLWAFNEEVVARAIYRSKIPIISAVGHEPDVTIADYVADLRAATPSNGAELAVPDQAELRQTLKSLEIRMAQNMNRRLKLARQELESKKRARVLRSPMEYFADRRQYLDGLHERMARIMGQKILQGRMTLHSRQEQLLPAWRSVKQQKSKTAGMLAARLDAMSPLKVLARGYSILEDNGGRNIRSAHQLQPGDQVTARLAEGKIHAIVDACMED